MKALVCTVVFLCIHYVLPYIMHGNVMIYHQLFMSAIVGTMFLISHNNQDIHTATPSNISPSSYTQFVQNTTDHTTSWGGLVACVLYGGINYQVEHHIVPAASPLVYHYMSPELRSILARHGMVYRHSGTFVECVWDFVKVVVRKSFP